MLHAFGRFVFDFGALVVGFMHSGSGTTSAIVQHTVHTLETAFLPMN